MRNSLSLKEIYAEDYAEDYCGDFYYGTSKKKKEKKMQNE